VLVNDKIYEAVRDQSGEMGGFGHGYTYSGHPVAAAVALETLKIYEERDIVSHIRAVSPALQDGLQQFADHPLVGEVRGVGLIGAVELIADKAAKTPFAAAAKVGPTLQAKSEANGLLIRAMGDSIGFCPPLIIDAPTIGEMMSKFAKSLDETLDWAKGEGLA